MYVCIRFLKVVVCDNLCLPFRDESFDAVLSIAVVHHFATVERRAMALRELARVTRIGGRLLLTVWAMEHEGRNFHSQVKQLKQCCFKTISM
jgi:ubiquinone/menaquinone biosynthesis C-methylase UbiE